MIHAKGFVIIINYIIKIKLNFTSSLNKINVINNFWFYFLAKKIILPGGVLNKNKFLFLLVFNNLYSNVY